MHVNDFLIAIKIESTFNNKFCYHLTSDGDLITKAYTDSVVVITRHKSSIKCFSYCYLHATFLSKHQHNIYSFSIFTHIERIVAAHEELPESTYLCAMDKMGGIKTKYHQISFKL